jgi:hypothetical protein
MNKGLAGFPIDRCPSEGINVRMAICDLKMPEYPILERLKRTSQEGGTPSANE